MDEQERRAAPQPRVSLVPEAHGSGIYVDEELVLAVADELDAHHWAMHVVECVNSGETRAAVIHRLLPRVCEAARRHNLHAGFYPSEW
jgi:hypothetical protein